MVVFFFSFGLLPSQPYEQISIQKRVAILKNTKHCRYFYGLIKSRMAIYRSTTLTYVPILDFSPMHSFKFAS